MKKLLNRIMILIVLLPAYFWLVFYTVTRNKTEKTFLQGFILWLKKEFKGGPEAPRRVYP